MRVPATEAERDESAARDRVRRIAQAAMDVFLQTVLYTPRGKPLDVEKLFLEVKTAAVTAAREYRARLT